MRKLESVAICSSVNVRGDSAAPTLKESATSAAAKVANSRQQPDDSSALTGQFWAVRAVSAVMLGAFYIRAREVKGRRLAGKPRRCAYAGLVALGALTCSLRLARGLDESPPWLTHRWQRIRRPTHPRSVRIFSALGHAEVPRSSAEAYQISVLASSRIGATAKGVSAG